MSILGSPNDYLVLTSQSGDRQNNQPKCPESTYPVVVLMKANKKPILRKGVSMNEFLLLAVIMIYVAILY